MATNIRISGVPEELLRAAKVEALATGRTLKEVVIGAIEREVNREIEVQKEHSKPSPKAQRRVPLQRRARNQAEKRPRSTIDPVALAPAMPAVPREQIKPCSHGLLFHPGCNC
jgi:sugar-specific transcriptional regulator TrmB